MANIHKFQNYYADETHEFPLENILELESPSTYECEITAYQKSKSVLTIHAHTQDSINTVAGYKLEFVVVSYSELFPMWDGLNISIAPPSECAEILSQIKYGTTPLSETVLRSNMLFTIQSKKRELRILASSLTAHPLQTKEDYLESLK